MSTVPGKVLAASHAVLGVSLLVAPMFSARLFDIEQVPSTTFVSRLVGSRDLALGGALWLAMNGSKDQRRLLLLTVNITNGVDIVSGLVTYLQGNLSEKALVLGEMGAIGLVGLGMWQSQSTWKRWLLDLVGKCCQVLE
jgi:hypothetical protein